MQSGKTEDVLEDINNASSLSPLEMEMAIWEVFNITANNSALEDISIDPEEPTNDAATHEVPEIIGPWGVSVSSEGSIKLCDCTHELPEKVIQTFL